MMINKIVLTLILSLVFLFSCKKKQIESLPQSNDPIFHVNGNFGGESIDFVAGQQNMVMQYGAEIRNGVEYVYSEMTNGNTAIKLGIFDGHLSIENYFVNLKVGDSLLFANKFSDILANLSKGNFSNDGNISNIDWYINGLFSGSNQVTISEPGVYDVCGNFTFSDDGSQKSICNKMYLGFEDDVKFSIKHFLSDNGDLKLWVEGDTQNFDSIQWKVDNEVIATLPSCSTNIGAEERVISVVIRHKNGGLREKSIVIDGTFSGHYIEDFSMCEIPTTERKWDNEVGVELKIDGEQYSSFELANYKSSLVIKDIHFYEVNSIGQKIAQLSIDVDAMLKSISTGQMKSLKFNAIFAYPIPN